MQITLEQLEKFEACSGGIRYFLSRDWKSDAEILEDLSRLNHIWMWWLATKFQLPLPAWLPILKCEELFGYAHPLPVKLKILVCQNLSGYDHRLPSGLKSLTCINLLNYDHPLPAKLKTLACRDLSNYTHPLPVKVKRL